MNHATISDDGRYRYALQRDLEMGHGSILFVMLNPSTADATHDDPTIKRCKAFATREGARLLWVANLYALRATDPRELSRTSDPIGPEWEPHTTALAMFAGRVVCAWGSHAPPERQTAVKSLLMRAHGGLLWCLGKTANGSPRHPLYLPKDTPLELY